MHGGKRIENLEEVMKVGDKIQVEIGEIDPKSKPSLPGINEINAPNVASFTTVPR